MTLTAGSPSPAASTKFASWDLGASVEREHGSLQTFWECKAGRVVNVCSNEKRASLRQEALATEPRHFQKRRGNKFATGLDQQILSPASTIWGTVLSQAVNRTICAGSA